MGQAKFELVQDETEPLKAVRQASDPALATQLLTIALTALSQKAAIAIASLFSLVLAASAFWLWYMILTEPSVLQLIGLGMYAIFILALHVIRYRGGR